MDRKLSASARILALPAYSDLPEQNSSDAWRKLSRRNFLISNAMLASSTMLPAQSLALPAALTPLEIAAASGEVALSGIYPEHLQGVCTNDYDLIYWSLTNKMVMTDTKGGILREINVADHHGDLCHFEGRIYVAVNLGLFNDPQERASSWIYVYDSKNLSFLARKKVDAPVYGAGGIAFGDGHFIVVGGLPQDVSDNRVFKYDRELNFIEEIIVSSGHTRLGIQTAAYNADHWWFGCYGSPEVTLRVDRTFKKVKKFTFDCAFGITPISREVFFVARGACSKDKGCVGSLVPAKIDEWIRHGTLK